MDRVRCDVSFALACTAILLAAACGKGSMASGSDTSAGTAMTAGQGSAGESAPLAGATGAAAHDAAGAASGAGGASGTVNAAAGSGAAGASASSAPTAGGGGASPTTAPPSGSGGASAPLAGAPVSAGAPAAAGAGGSSAPPALGPDCGSDPLASKRPHGSGFFQQFTGLFGCTAAADLALYRKMLPEKFEVPAQPQVCFYTIDFKISGVGPYHEAAILLPITYKGESGHYVLTMPLDNRSAMSGGRAVGFPKYMAEVTIKQDGNNWVGTASANGSADLKASYTGECTESDELIWPDFINMTPIPAGTSSTAAFLPPRTGSALRVPAEHLTPPAFHSLKGSVRLEIADNLPWNGLVDELTPFPGLLTSLVGGINLGNQPLD